MNRSEFTANLELQPKDVPNWQRPAPVRAVIEPSGRVIRATRRPWLQRVRMALFGR